MKSNFLKLVLPAFAILMAVGLAFATEDKPVFQDAYYFDPVDEEWKSTIAEEGCGENGGEACTYGPMNLQLYSDDDFGSIQLRKE